MTDDTHEIVAFEGESGNDVLDANRPFVHLIFALTGGGRFNVGDYGVSQCGQFSHSYLEEHHRWRQASEAWCNGDEDAYEKAGIKYRGFSSPGMGYTPETTRAMAEAGFHLGPAVALKRHHYSSYRPGYYPDSKEIARHPLHAIKQHFEGLGISCFFAQGGSFPDKIDYEAVVFDISDRIGTLQKLKPDFLEYFVPIEAQSLSRPNHMHTPELMAGYCRAVMLKLREYGERIGAEYEHDQTTGIETLPQIRPDIPERSDSQADYHLEFATAAFDAMLPVLSPEERRMVILQLASKLAGREFDYGAAGGVPELPALEGDF